jgi:hypothetical protein
VFVHTGGGAGDDFAVHAGLLSQILTIIPRSRLSLSIGSFADYLRPRGGLRRLWTKRGDGATQQIAASGFIQVWQRREEVAGPFRARLT